MTKTNLPRILFAQRVQGNSPLNTMKQSINSHNSIRESIKRANLKLICNSIYGFVSEVSSLDVAIATASASTNYSHIILDGTDVYNQKLFPNLLRKYDSGFIIVNPPKNPLDYLRETGADFAIIDNHIRGSSIPFEEQIAETLDLITKRITNGYFINDKLFNSRKNRVLMNRYSKNYDLAKGRKFSWLK